jgi:basic membrane lipoprotein Med (substrate-binding protein (PBP1-ABC) superfamily)
VGPTGSGKSSVLAAGLVPRLRDGTVAGSPPWEVVSLVPTASSLDEIEAVVRMRSQGRRLLVIDQFEDLFAVADETVRRRFLRALAAGLRDDDVQLTAVLALRADFYDRPLLDPEFAEIFIPGVMNVLPMTAEELRAAILGPAERAGVTVETGLLAALVADTSAQPGALPLLQFALTELFERGDGSTLTLAEYRALGALHGILSRRAEGLYAGLDAAGRQVSKQVFLRLVRPGRGTVDSRRRPPLSELADLDVDPVALSEVLDTFGRHRLLSFDRDPVTGDATVEVAHEALLREWERLAGWIDRHRAALRRHGSFGAAAEEWEAAGRDPDYRLSGSRLVEFETTIQEGALQLTGRERAFLEASLERQRSEHAARAARAAASRRLERLARTRLLALGVAIAALIAVSGYALLGVTAGGRAPVALLYNGDGLFTASLIIQGGFDRAVTDFGLTPRKLSVTSGSTADEAMRTVSQDGAGLVVVAAVDANVDAVAPAFPGTRYAVIDLPATQPNVVHLAFADNESSFLAGVVAAKTTRTGTIGFIGGADSPVIWPFAAGYEAGARAVDPSIRILSAYLGPNGKYDGFTDPTGAEAQATEMYRSGADVIFAAAGDSGTGVFAAASHESASTAHQLWAIGVDADQYVTVGDNPANADWRAWQPHILTSVLKRMDTAVYDLVADYAHAQLATGTRRLGLAAQAVDLSTSGGFIDGLRDEIDTWRARIVAGSVAVPCVPVGREAQAGALSADPTGCGG